MSHSYSGSGRSSFSRYEKELNKNYENPKLKIIRLQKPIEFRMETNDVINGDFKVGFLI